MKNITQLGAVSALLVNSLNVQASPVQWTEGIGANDHWYEFVAISGQWTSARRNALLSTYNGMNGYLVTITSSEEQDFLLGLSTEGWIGATDKDNEGTWIWADGPEANTIFWQGRSNGSAVGGNFSSWNPGEPNNVNGGEDFAELNEGKWNDLTWMSVHNREGYFVEYSSISTVPVPASVWLFGSSLIGLIGMKRKSKNATFSA